MQGWLCGLLWSYGLQHNFFPLLNFLVCSNNRAVALLRFWAFAPFGRRSSLLGRLVLIGSRTARTQHPMYRLLATSDVLRYVQLRDNQSPLDLTYPLAPSSVPAHVHYDLANPIYQFALHGRLSLKALCKGWANDGATRISECLAYMFDVWQGHFDVLPDVRQTMLSLHSWCLTHSVMLEAFQPLADGMLEMKH